MKTDRIRRHGLTRTYSLRETFDGLPAEVWQVSILQQKTSWSEQDHARIAELTRKWTVEHRRRYEQRWNFGRAARLVLSRPRRQACPGRDRGSQLR